jgi:hypothetical protein
MIDNLRLIEDEINERINDLIEAAVEDEEKKLRSFYVGRKVQITRCGRWYPTLPETLIEAQIDDVRLHMPEDSTSTLHEIMFYMKARDPHTGHNKTIERSRRGVKFIN